MKSRPRTVAGDFLCELVGTAPVSMQDYVVWAAHQVAAGTLLSALVEAGVNNERGVNITVDTPLENLLAVGCQMYIQRAA